MLGKLRLLMAEYCKPIFLLPQTECTRQQCNTSWAKMKFELAIRDGRACGGWCPRRSCCQILQLQT